MTLGPLPEVYRTKRPLHDDWPWPLSLIPRRWTGLGLPMPPVELAGNVQWESQSIQLNYPFHGAYIGQPPFTTMLPSPVPGLGKWTIQGVKLGWLTIPCYFAFSTKVFSRRLHFNGPLKPDVTSGDWFWWFECSLSWTKIT